MKDHKQTVNAGRFVRDLRTGKGRAELMNAYGLSSAAFDKLLQILVERKLISTSEAQSISTSPAAKTEASVPAAGAASRSLPRVPNLDERSNEPESTCSQCGAKVGRKDLTCPECGHVLPGEDRWASPDQEKGLLARVPRKALGWGLALPAIVAMFFILKDVVVPMTGLMTDKKAEDARKSRPDLTTPVPLPQTPAETVSTEAIEEEVAALIADGTLSSVKGDYTKLITGAAWEALEPEDREKVILRLRDALGASGLPEVFDMEDPFGNAIARVTETSVEFVSSGEAPGSAGGESRTSPALQPGEQPAQLLPKASEDQVTTSPDLPQDPEEP